MTGESVKIYEGYICSMDDYLPFLKCERPSSAIQCLFLLPGWGCEQVTLFYKWCVLNINY